MVGRYNTAIPMQCLSLIISEYNFYDFLGNRTYASVVILFMNLRNGDVTKSKFCMYKSICNLLILKYFTK